LEGAIDAAQRAEVTIYAISTNWNSKRQSCDLGNNNLRKLAEQTGGRVLMPSDPKAVTKAFAKIGEELRSRYAISYRPADFVSDGHYRKIKIHAHQAGEKVQIRARKGYYASPASRTNAESHGTDSTVTLASR
jgi:VWFA-related protein